MEMEISIIYLDEKEYIDLYKKFHSCGQLSSRDFMHSGDPEYDMEYNKKMIHDSNHFNPNNLPIFIDLWTSGGRIRYARKK